MQQALPAQIAMAIEVTQVRLRRAQDVLSCLAFAADEGAELDFGPVAIAARDLIDRVLEDLSTFGDLKRPGEDKDDDHGNVP